MFLFSTSHIKVVAGKTEATYYAQNLECRLFKSTPMNVPQYECRRSQRLDASKGRSSAQCQTTGLYGTV